MIKIMNGKIGRDAYKLSRNWRLGVHLFDYIRGGKTLRLVYLRTKKHTHYIDLIIKSLNERLDTVSKFKN